ncbi:MAG: antirepressor regulating drug resistance protein [Clostridiales bacterium]|jgi:beta-lactamase regulating signal transducer with metallopeptidase domain|nr:antirepressor regulating drug resistance protein [Clostridiales bacterium]
MFAEIFYWVLNISIIGSGAGLVVLILRRVKKLPRFAVYLLWVIPLLRLWIPFGIANQYSLLSLVSKFTTRTVVIWEEVPRVTMSNFIMGANSYFPIKYKTNLIESILGVASVVWIIVAVAAVLTSIMLYFFTRSELRSLELIRDNIYKSNKITSPAVYGIIHPKIIIPEVITEGDINYIIIHEEVHIWRKDNLFRVIAVITACVHWFNPLSWVFLKCFFEDMELACDAKVLKNLEERQTKEYASAILACAAGRTFFSSAFGGARTRLRIENVLSYNKLTMMSTLCFAALVAAIMVALITNATI